MSSHVPYFNCKTFTYSINTDKYCCYILYCVSSLIVNNMILGGVSAHHQGSYTYTHTYIDSKVPNVTFNPLRQVSPQPVSHAVPGCNFLTDSATGPDI